MTKIKNTKKGMAKKTLSISLAVAMLATSNVPVWAAEFTDGSDAAPVAVEAPVEDAFTDAEAIPAEVEAPVVDETTETPEAYSLDDNADEVNIPGYKVEDLKIGAVGSWGDNQWVTPDTVSIEGTITDKDGNPVKGLCYTWLADGVKGAAEGAEYKGNKATLADITYKPVHKDFNKQLSVVIYKLGEDGGVIYRTTLTGDKVKAVDISSSFKDDPVYLEGVGNDHTLTYNGEEQKPSINSTIDTNVTVTDGSEKALTNKDFKWHYETPGNDFTNVTDENIEVYGTLAGTYDITSPAYGYTAKTNTANYHISPYWFDKFEATLSTTSVVYKGVKPAFDLDDVKVEVFIKDNNGNITKKVDITDTFKEVNFEGTGVTVGTGYGYIGKGYTLADTDAAKKIRKNFNFYNHIARPWAFNGTYDVTTLDLSKCTAIVEKEFTANEINVPGVYTLAPEHVTLILDGEEIYLENIMNYAQVSTEASIRDAAAANPARYGLVDNAFKIHYKDEASKTNVKGIVYADAMLVRALFGKTYILQGDVDGDVASEWTEMPTSKTTAGNVSVNYIGKAYSLTETSGALHDLQVNVPSNTEAVPEDSYTVSYNDNVNAGIVEVTITGKNSYVGCSKKVYFKINKDVVLDKEFEVNSTVTVNPVNNHDAALYKDALGMKFETELADDSKAILEEGKDYTVEYYYADKANLTSVESIKANTGLNKPENFVYVVATPIKDGNYTANGAEIVDFAKIVEKSITDATVTVEKDSYTFTGEEIAAKVTVKDGTVVLEEGEDYILKYKDNINVGTATVTVIPTAASDYNTESTATATFEITPAKAEDVKIVLKDGKNAKLVAVNTFDYCGKQIRPEVDTIKLNGVDVKDFFDIDYPAYGENVNAGKEMGRIIVSPKEMTPANFTGTKTQLFNIKGKELNGGLKLYYGDKTEVVVKNAWAKNKQNGNYSFYYDGTAQVFGDAKFTPESLIDVKEGVDYEIKYINNVNAGTGFVAVVAKGNYENNTKDVAIDKTYKVIDGVLYKNNVEIANNIIDIVAFNIVPSYFTARNINVANGIYAGGKPVKPTVTVEVNGRVLVEGKDYTVELTSIKGDATPDEFVDVTADKPYYARIKAMGGYEFDPIYGTSEFIWGIDKKDLADCFVTVTKNGEEFDITVMNGNVVETKEAFEVKDNGDKTATVSVVDGGKNYTGSITVDINDPADPGKVGQAMIEDVNVIGNKATVILSGEVDNATGYDYVIATEEDYKNGRVAVTKNQLRTTGDFNYVQKGVYYAYCHAWTRDSEGKKVFGDWSNLFRFEVNAITPSTPVITSVEVKGSTVTVNYTESKDALGYDVVLGSAVGVVSGERRPVEYGDLVAKNVKDGRVSVTFKNVPEGKYYAGLHAFNRSRADSKKVFSKWSNVKTVTVR